jgi:GTP-binding protein EngB required for normal cell division
LNLSDYERAKFELAAILRSAKVRLRSEDTKRPEPFIDLFARLAEDRFNLVVAGRFSRGKSSLMNALLDTERLPMGIVPITSVITTVSYGTRERALIDFEGSHFPLEVKLDALSSYVTQQANPGNERLIDLARVELPAELLRRGFHFVDTPGLGSSVFANTQTTERFLPQADALMLVTSFDSALTQDELQAIRRIAPSPARVFLVVNKADLVTASERAEALAHVVEHARGIFGEQVPMIYAVSAREGLEAIRHGDAARYAESGLGQLKADLTQFLLTQKRALFLSGMCKRVGDALSEVPDSAEDTRRLRALEHSLAQDGVEAPLPQRPAEALPSHGTGRFTSCAVCETLDQGLYDFLCHYQFELLTQQAAQDNLASHYGLCAFHYWQLGSIAGPHGICVSLAPVVDRWAAHLRGLAGNLDESRRDPQWAGLHAAPSSCDLCRVHAEIETTAVRGLVKRLEATDGVSKATEVGLCVQHLQRVLQAIGPDNLARQVLLRESAALQRLAEDMRRAAAQRDGLRRALASEEDRSAERRALMVLGGHRNVFALRKLD